MVAGLGGDSVGTMGWFMMVAVKLIRSGRGWTLVVSY